MGFSRLLEVVTLKKPINIAVLGAGYWGRKVTAEYVKLANTNPTLTLARVCDLKEENLKLVSDSYGVDAGRLSTEYKEIFYKDDVDAVHICTPNETHYELCREALSADKHVLIEKPMALSAKEAWDLVRLAESKRLCLQVGHIFRFNNALNKMQELIARNYFGTLYYLRLQWTTWMPSPLGRDIIFDLGPHPVDIVNHLLEKWPTKVACSARAYRRSSLEEVAHITMEFGENVISYVELSWLLPGKIRELAVMGAERSAVVDCLGQTIRIFEDNNGRSFSFDVVQNNTILDEVSHFVSSIQDENNNKNPGKVGAGNTAVLECIRKSLAQEKTMCVDLGS